MAAWKKQTAAWEKAHPEHAAEVEPEPERATDGVSLRSCSFGIRPPPRPPNPISLL
jgi:hypothetical protein